MALRSVTLIEIADVTNVPQRFIDSRVSFEGGFVVVHWFREVETTEYPLGGNANPYMATQRVEEVAAWPAHRVLWVTQDWEDYHETPNQVPEN